MAKYRVVEQPASVAGKPVEFGVIEVADGVKPEDVADAFRRGKFKFEPMTAEGAKKPAEAAKADPDKPR